MRSGFAFTLEHWNLYDSSPAWRDMLTGTKEEKTAKMKDPAIREAVKSDGPDARSLDKNAPGIGGRLPKLVVQWVENKPELEKYVGKSLGTDWPGGRQASGGRDGRSVARHRLEGRVPAGDSAIQRRVQRRDHQQLAVSLSRASRTAARTPSSSPAARLPPTSCAGWCATSNKVSLEEAHYRLSALARARGGLQGSRHPARRRGG